MRSKPRTSPARNTGRTPSGRRVCNPPAGRWKALLRPLPIQSARERQPGVRPPAGGLHTRCQQGHRVWAHRVAAATVTVTTMPTSNHNPGDVPPAPDAANGSGFVHVPVMVDEVVGAFAPVPAGWVVDATVGGGGHASAILDAHPSIGVIGLDQDPDAVDVARARLASHGDRVRVHRSRFDRLSEILAADGIEGISGVLFDLGVSSPQFDRPERGFSYRNPGPVDMRMDRSQALSADDIVNTWSAQEIASMLRRNSDERHADRIARAMVAARPVRTTTELADIVRSAIPAATRRHGGHPAKRTFQALRIEVNDELGILDASLQQAIDALRPGGRIAVLSYHSGEDRIAKRRLRLSAGGDCTCPPELPCGCGSTPVLRLVRSGGVTPTAHELAANPRAASARLRVAEKLAGGQNQ